MEAILIQLCNMGISASWLILAIIVVRFLLQKAPKWTRCLMWILVAARLICPVSPVSVFSLLPSAEVIPKNIAYVEQPAIHTGISPVNSIVNPVLAASMAPTAGDSVNPMQVFLAVAAVIWVAGMAIMLASAVVSYVRIRRNVSVSLHLKENLYFCDDIRTPFILGLIRPRIYLPSTLNEEEMTYVIAHEKAHIRRLDHWWKPFGYLLLSVYWFHPLIWIAYFLLCRDIELACDEAVIYALGETEKKPYAEALLCCSAPRKMIAACPLAFGEVGVKDRIQAILRYKKPAYYIIALAIVSCIIIAVCFLTNPASKEPDLSFLYYKNAISLVADVEEITAIYRISSEEGEFEEASASIQIGVTNGADLAKQLDKWQWKECRAPRQTLSSPGSVEFIIEDEYRITVYQKKAGSLRQYAVVSYLDEKRYYKIDRSDYPDAVALVHAPAVGSGEILDQENPDEIIIYNGKEYKKSELCSATLQWLELSEQERMFSSYLPPEFLVIVEPWGVTMTVENVTPAGATLVCTQSGGDATGALKTGNWYVIEDWTQKNGWKEVDYVQKGDIAWTEEAWMIHKDSVTKWEINWEWLYGELKPGKYRIGKSVMDFRATGNYDNVLYFAEFEIGQDE